jgi:hypothetical protein
MACLRYNLNTCIFTEELRHFSHDSKSILRFKIERALNTVTQHYDELKYSAGK